MKPPRRESMNWTEVRTAYQVGRLGTVSAAAAYLGVHRATVVRHIDSLEATFGEKLFHRHAKGYAPTELGRGLLRVAEATEEQFNQLVGWAKGRSNELSGEFVIASVDTVAPLLLPSLREFLAAHPNLTLRYLSSPEVLKLEYGEAHCAIRLGTKPTHPDSVVQALGSLPMGLFASPSYVTAHGRPKSTADLANHSFLDFDNGHQCPGCEDWMRAQVRDPQRVFRASTIGVLEQALRAGIGIGFLPLHSAHGLLEIVPREASWSLPLWLVTHLDLHRSAKVRAFAAFLKRSTPLEASTP
ncbi:MAG: LysR family transcriptional regulator [Myxococcota bacterium]